MPLARPPGPGAGTPPPTGVEAQLSQPSDRDRRDQHGPADGSKQQRYPEREMARGAEVRHLDVVLVVEDEDQEQDEHDERGDEADEGGTDAGAADLALDLLEIVLDLRASRLARPDRSARYRRRSVR